VSRKRLSLPARILSGARKVTTCGAHCSFSCVSLHGAVPYSYPREGVQSALDCRIQNAPPPLTPEMAIPASVRSALLDRPRIPPRSSARTVRSPLFWLNLLKRFCCSEITGCWFAPKRFWLRERRWLLARSQNALGRLRSAGCWLVHKTLLVA
jgi:hypothetical protein